MVMVQGVKDMEKKNEKLLEKEMYEKPVMEVERIDEEVNISTSTPSQGDDSNCPFDTGMGHNTGRNRSSVSLFAGEKDNR